MSWFQQESRPNGEDQWSQILSGQWASSSTQKVAGSVFAVSLPKWLLVAVKELAWESAIRNLAYGGRNKPFIFLYDVYCSHRRSVPLQRCLIALCPPPPRHGDTAHQVSCLTASSVFAGGWWMDTGVLTWRYIATLCTLSFPFGNEVMQSRNELVSNCCQMTELLARLKRSRNVSYK